MISKQAQNKKLLKDALQIAAEAKKRKAEYPQTIDATIGTLQNEEGKFHQFHTVNQTIQQLTADEYFTYSPSDGGKAFKDAVLHWIFRDSVNEIVESMHCEVVATPGGTGAVSNAIYNSLDEGETLVFPNLYWGPYANMAFSYNLNVEKYEFIKDNQFNISDFQSRLIEVSRHQKTVATIINDPCNNPSGYSLTAAELESIIDFCNANPTIDFSIIYDIAYLDYDRVGVDAVRHKLRLLMKANSNVVIHLAFSGSKSFAIYGLRLGAHVILSKDPLIAKQNYNSSCYLARSRWSNASKVGISILIKMHQKLDLQTKMDQEIANAVQMLEQRGQLFLKQAKEAQLDVLPYGGGFFITIPYDQSEALMEELKNQDIFVLAFDRAIRVSVGALSINEVNGLAQAIKASMNTIEKNN